jgi:hypothetical protein
MYGRKENRDREKISVAKAIDKIHIVQTEQWTRTVGHVLFGVVKKRKEGVSIK